MAFANTASNRASSRPTERLNSYADLAAWSRSAGILSEAGERRLQQEAARRPEAAVGVLRQAITLREAIYRIFSACTVGSAPEAADLEELNATLARAHARLRLVSTAGGFAWDWQRGAEALDEMLWPVARSAADLLTSEDLGRVGQCQSDTCDWLFVDRSRNHSRRWCDMGDCGNRAKARRYYRRKTAQVSQP